MGNASSYCVGYGPDADMLLSAAKGDAGTESRVLALLGEHPRLLTCRRGLSNECSIWHFAAKNGRIGLLQHLLEFARGDLSPFASLSVDQREAKIRGLLDMKNGKGQTPLHLACKRGHLACTEFLIEMVSRVS